ncbi:hypothetical protein BH24ACT4_BH24ACT4_06250 [soil metagenome]
MPDGALDPARPLSRRGFLVVASGAAAVLVVGCGGDEEPVMPSGPPVDSFTIVAQNIAWDRTELKVTAGVEVTATIDNRDQSIDHNLHIKSPGSPKTPLEKGPVVQMLTFTVDEPGTYDFLCDAHPQMDGTLFVV